VARGTRREGKAEATEEKKTGEEAIRLGLRMWGQSPEGPTANAFNTSSKWGDATDGARIARQMSKTKCTIRNA
jgi:hypothetical protein